VKHRGRRDDEIVPAWFGWLFVVVAVVLGVLVYMLKRS
jgi:hypothetical protein